MTIVRKKHLRDRAGRICPEVKQWWRARGLDWAKFIRDGIPAEDLRAAAPDDVRVQWVIRAAERDNG